MYEHEKNPTATIYSQTVCIRNRNIIIIIIIIHTTARGPNWVIIVMLDMEKRVPCIYLQWYLVYFEHDSMSVPPLSYD